MTFQLNAGSVVPDEVIAAGTSVGSDGIGNVQECAACGASADQAPEGVYGYHRPVPVNVKNADGSKKYKAGDPIWEAQHCFKCGYRPGTNSAVFDEIKARQAFEKWYAERTADTASHPTQQGFNPAQTDQVRTILTEALQGFMNAGGASMDVGVRPGVVDAGTTGTPGATEKG